MTIAYCVKCRMKREMKSEKTVKSKNGRKMIKGICSKCGTNMCKFI